MMAIIKKYFFFVTVIFLLILSVLSSYYRFVYQKDYFATYETDCDPETHSCYIYCEDDDEDCLEPYYYAYMERYAADLWSACGNNVEECEFAHDCSIEPEKSCKIEYCDSEFGFYECSNQSE